MAEDSKVTTATGEASTTVATVKDATATDGIQNTFESIRENFVSIYGISFTLHCTLYFHTNNHPWNPIVGDAAIPYKQKPEILLPLIARMRLAAGQISDKTQKGSHVADPIILNVIMFLCSCQK